MAKVLVVDDDLMFALDLQHQVRRLGHEVVGMARNSSEARKAFAETVPDLVLMDVYLAGQMDGIETVRGLRGSSRLPVIFMSSTDDEQTISRAVDEGPYAYLLKPFNRGELAESMDLALYQGGGNSRYCDGQWESPSGGTPGREPQCKKTEKSMLPASARRLAEVAAMEHKQKEVFALFRSSEEHSD
jgi:DNA-binding response OmpR family regulator